MTSKPSPVSEVEVLSPEQCWALLRGVSVGRLAIWVNDHPDIFPINYKVDHGTLVFRTGEGTKLHAALGETPVALEADGVDQDAGIAWSVVVKGEAAGVKLTQELLDTVGLRLFPWQAGRKDAFVRIVPTSISGRRFKVTSPLTWWSPLDDATRAGLE
ncbi:pyridoxamine 5'-phosphate oxidase family protein [Arthrobacter silvisoli]|uniref:pyridoxamine 5'-phosphate oxidase family protein n=1 Tax=Arthrobacter silvisoli TaxID=2291022 RepID=UPI000E210675|nr:pyridoxamine 5'-phosphate oxidase family protein [Arthrobacter silvisoli]